MKMFLIHTHLILVLLVSISFGQDELKVMAGHEEELGISEFMMYDFFIKQADSLRNKSAIVKSEYKTPADWNGWQEFVREKFIQSIGAFPERTPLNARFVRRLERDTYSVENIIYESRPQYYVTANVYVPKSATVPMPAVLVPCGHGPSGKTSEGNQRMCIALAQKGFVVMTYDPMGQGERSEYVDVETGKDLYRRGTQQHSQAGLLCYLTGTNLAQYFIWDGIRGIDYLCSREDVDSTRIGVTGVSGGGTLTTFITAMENRVKVSVPVCYITRLQDRMSREGEVSHDSEQNIVNMLKWGIDIADLLMPHAPKSLLIGAGQQDFFPFKGALLSFNELQEVYADFCKPEKIALAQADDGHGYTLPRRERMYAWMLRWLGNQNQPWREPDIQVEPESSLFCTESGSVALSLGGETVWSMNKKFAESTYPQRKNPADIHDVEKMKSDVREKLVDLLSLPVLEKHPQVKTFTPIEQDGITIEKIAIQSEKGIWIPGFVYHPVKKQSTYPLVMMIHEFGKDQLHEEAIKNARNGRMVFSFDPRGIGETMDTFRGKGITSGYYDWGADETSFTYSSFIIGRNMVGLRVFDVLTALNYISSRTDIDRKNITLYGKGHAGLIALFSAALDERISAVVCEKTLATYMSLIDEKMYDCHIQNFVPGILLECDLPQVAAIVAPRSLTLIEPIDAQKNILPANKAEKLYGIAQECYKITRSKNFKIESLK